MKNNDKLGQCLLICGALLLAAWRINVPSGDIQPYGGSTVIMGGNSTNSNYAATAGYAQTANICNYALDGNVSYAQQANICAFAQGGNVGYAANSNVSSYAQSANVCAYAVSGGNVQYSLNSNQAAFASYALNSNTSSYAQSANTCTYATTGGNVAYAANSNLAAYATLCGTASSTSGNANTATFAQSANVSNYASNANLASYASTSGVSASTTGNANTASYASNANVASYALNSNLASYAAMSGVSSSTTGNANTATYAQSANVSNYSSNSNLAVYSQNSNLASYASNSNVATYATTAGTANIATNSANSNNALMANSATNVVAGGNIVTNAANANAFSAAYGGTLAAPAFSTPNGGLFSSSANNLSWSLFTRPIPVLSVSVGGGSNDILMGNANDLSTTLGAANIVIGQNISQNSTTGTNTINIGTNYGSGSVSSTYGIAIGTNVNLQSNGGTAIGFGASVPAGFLNSVAIGGNATVTNANQIMLGTVSQTVAMPGNANIGGSFASQGNTLTLGVASNPNAVYVSQYTDAAYGETQYGFVVPARIGTNPSTFNNGMLAFGGLDPNHMGLVGSSANPNGVAGFTGGTISLRNGDNSSTLSSGFSSDFFYSAHAGPFHANNGGSATSPVFQICNALNANNNAYINCSGMHGGGGALYLDSNGTLALTLDTAQKATFASNVVANGNYAFANGTMLSSNANGTLQVGTSASGFGSLLFGGATSATGVQLVSSALTLTLKDGSGATPSNLTLAANVLQASNYINAQNAIFANSLGTAAAPFIRNSTSGNTGVYWPTTTSVAFSTAGVSALALDANQNATFTGSVTTPNVVANGNVTNANNIYMPNANGINTSAIFLGPLTSSGVQIIRNGAGIVQFGLADASGNATLQFSQARATNDLGVGAPNYATGYKTNYGLYISNSLSTTNLVTAGVSALAADATQNITITGNLSGQRRASTAKTAAYTFAVGQSGDSGKTFNNNGAAASVPFTLPACATATLGFGARITNLTVSGSNGFTLTTNGTDTILLGGVSQTNKTTITTTVLGSAVEFNCESAGVWSTIFSGTFTSN